MIQAHEVIRNIQASKVFGPLGRVTTIIQFQHLVMFSQPPLPPAHIRLFFPPFTNSNDFVWMDVWAGTSIFSNGRTNELSIGSVTHLRSITPSTTDALRTGSAPPSLPRQAPMKRRLLPVHINIISTQRLRTHLPGTSTTGHTAQGDEEVQGGEGGHARARYRVQELETAGLSRIGRD